MNFESANNQDAGFIKLWHNLRNWEWFDDPNMLALWIHLLLKANWKDKNWRGIEIKRGQCVIGRKQLCKETGISEQTIKTCLNRLKSTSEITIKVTNKFSILTIVKYDLYNEKSKEVTSKITSKLTSNQPATNQQLTTTKDNLDYLEKEEDKNINISALRFKKNDQEYTEEFEAFWMQCPKKVGKGAAFRAYQKAIKKSHPSEILQGMMIYSAKTIDPKFIKHPSGWLNDERWKDEEVKPSKNGRLNDGKPDSNHKSKSNIDIFAQLDSEFTEANSAEIYSWN